MEPLMGKVIPIAAGQPTELVERTDDELMLLARGGRRAAFATLIKRHQQRALHLAHKMLADRQLAHDVVQNSFVSVFEYLPRYQAQGKFVAFLTRFVVFNCRHVWRSEAAGRKALAKVARIPRDPPDLPDHEILRQQQIGQVKLAVGKLSEVLREVLVLRYTSELSYDEIAQILEIPLGTVKSRLFSALEQMRQLIGGSGR